MASAFWHTAVRNRILALSFSLLAIILSTVYGQYRLNQWNIPFYNALERRDVDEFARQLVVFAIIAGSLLLLKVVQSWLNQITALYMREGLSRDLVDEWLKPQRGLKLAQMRSIGVNPDQRLHEDARNLSELTTSLAIGLVNATILLVSFIGVLWSVSGDFSFRFNDTTVSIPGYMVWAALGYAGLASLLSNIVGRRLPELNAQRYSKEAELRFALMRTSENLTAITLARGEQNDRARVQGAITTVLGVIRRLAIGYTHLTWVSAGFGWLSIVAPILIAAPVYFAGNLTFGGLMMTVGAFNQVYGALRWYVDNFRQIADWKATLQRVSTFRHALVSMENAPVQGGLTLTLSDDGNVSLKELELWALPPGEAHNHGLRLPADEVFTPGDRVMINGEAGADRRLLFQSLAGVWQWGSGQVSLPRTGQILFMQQAPYLPHASLREVLVYPLDPSRFDDDRLAAALERVGLSPLTAALGLTERWDQKLSEEDQARLRLANVLVTEPKWLFMDDILEGLDADVQSEMAAVLSELENVTMVYIGLSAAFDEIVRPRHIHLQQIRAGAAVAKDRPGQITAG